MTFLAKSNGETLVEHTNNLLKQLNILKTTYPNVLSSKHWDLLAYACAYHDLGKINDKFQTKIRHNWKTIDGEIPHGLLSVTLIDFNTLKKQFSDYELKALTYAVACHHNRDFSKLDKQHYLDEIKNLNNAYEKLNLNDLLIELPTQVPAKVKTKYYKFAHIWTLDEIEENWLLTDDEKEKQKQAFALFIKIKGLLNRLDYAASGHYFIESNPRLELDNNILSFLGKNAQYNDLQNWTYQHRNQNIVVTAQTGLGKTESALRWLNNDKSFFVLPLKTALNAMYDRFKDEVFAKDLNKSNKYLALLHSGMLSFLLKDVKTEDFNRNVNEDRQWSKQLSLATLDQVFSFVYHYQGYEPKLATLSYAKIVIDEIQMYSPDLLAYLLFGLKEIQKYDGKFDVMTATLAPFVLDLFKKYGIDFIQPEHAFLDDKINHRHKAKTVHAQLTANDVLNLNRNQKTLVVVNTVKKAVELFNELRASNKNVHLIHSRFIKIDRNQKEQEIYDFSRSDKSGIWIGTQIVEASLDIDFDLLITELSELNGLFQRMGRCYRKRNYNGKKPNVYVFDGGDKNPSGINHGKHSVVNYQMYLLSKNAIKDLDEYLSEQQKLNLINKNYTSKNLSQDDNSYINQVENDYKYLLAKQSEQISKAETRRIFRNIQSVDVIPEQVYLDNQDTIDTITNKLLFKKYNNKTDSIKLHEQLNSYCVNIYSYLVQDENLIDIENLNKLHYLVLSKDFEYSKLTGLSIKKEQSNEDNNFF